jgi:hypothetical protein
LLALAGSVNGTYRAQHRHPGDDVQTPEAPAADVTTGFGLAARMQSALTGMGSPRTA